MKRTVVSGQWSVVSECKKRALFVLDWVGFLLLLIITMPLLYCIAASFVRAMGWDR